MISFKNLTKEYTLGKPVLSDFNLEVKEGEFITFFGPNGSGKSTLLNCVAGIEKITDGHITINDRTPEKSKVSFVFQNYNESLLPWRTVVENITFPLEMQNLPQIEMTVKAEQILQRLKIEHLKDKLVYELSGGQKQLVCIARAFIVQPEVLLMDEPFSSLDYQTTKKMEMELLRLWQENKVTTLCVSHDIDEAIILADKVVVLSPHPGKIKAVFEVSLPRSRNLEMLSSPEFFELRKKILQSYVYA